MNTEIDMRPPQDEQAEMSLLGALLTRYGQRAGEILGAITPEDFYFGRHRAIFEACAAVHDAENGLLDPILVGQELSRRDELDKVGGAPYLHDLMGSAMGDPLRHAEIVAEKAHLRRLIEAGTRVVRLAYQGGDESKVADVIEDARQILDDATSGLRRGLAVSHADELAGDALERYAGPPPPVLHTGWTDLDAILGGLRPGTLTVVAARPGMGKTLLGVNAAMHAAECGYGALFVSLEMTESQLIDRVLASLARVELSKIDKRELGDADWERLRYAQVRLASWALTICDQANLGLTGIRTLARDAAHTRRGLGLVVVDYLQLMRPADTRVSREQQVSAFSRGLKLLAKELHVPVVALAQLNRGTEGRKRPAVADLRESGAIEADADAVALLHRDPADEDQQQSKIEVIVGKNRHGRQGTCALAWRPHYARADNLRRLEAV